MKVFNPINLLLFLSIQLFSVLCTAQSADETIGRLMNEQNMFELRELHRKLSGQISPFLDFFAQAMLAESFNQAEQGIIAVDTLLSNTDFQQQLGIENIAYLIYLKSGFLETLFRYQESAELLESFLAQTKEVPFNEGLKSFMKSTLVTNKVLAGLPPTKVNKPKSDEKIPLFADKTGKGTALNIPCNINGSEVNLCLDTGNPKYTVVTKEFAEKHNIQSKVDSVAMQGVGSGFASIGLAQNLSIGNIQIENPLFYIVDKISPIDSIKIEAVLGSEILNALGEIQLYPQKEKMIIPASASEMDESEQNLIMNSRHIFVRTDHNNEKALMHFDTGSTVSHMSNIYFAENEDFIKRTATKDSIRLAGFGGISRQMGYMLPSLDFTINKTAFQLRDISVYTENTLLQWNESGCFGADFVLKFHEVIISYENMFLKVVE